MSDLLTTVSSLTAAGFAGVGVVVFLLLFILLMRGKPIDDASARLYNRFLTWGVIFAFFCGGMSVLSAWIKPASMQATPTNTDVMVDLSPSFETRKLTPPVIRINGKTVQPEEPITLTGNNETIFIGVDQALADVDAIKQTVQNYSQSVTALTQQRDALASALPPAAAPPAAAADVKAAGEQTNALQSQINTAIANGDFAKAAAASRQLKSPMLLRPAALDHIRMIAPQQ